MSKENKKVKYEISRGCTLCLCCVNECPEKAITVTRQGAVIDQNLCIGCGLCARGCPYDAIVEVTHP